MYVVIWALIYIEIKYSLVMIDNCIEITWRYFTLYHYTGIRKHREEQSYMQFIARNLLQS